MTPQHRGGVVAGASGCVRRESSSQCRAGNGVADEEAKRLGGATVDFRVNRISAIARLVLARTLGHFDILLEDGALRFSSGVRIWSREQT